MIPISMNIGVNQHQVPRRRFNPRCLARVADLNDPQGRRDCRYLVMGCFTLMFIAEFALAIWSYTHHPDLDNMDEQTLMESHRLLISFACSIIFFIFQFIAFRVIYQVTNISHQVEELSPEERDLEMSFRRYCLYTAFVQCFYIAYLSMLVVSQLMTAYILILIAALAFMATSMDMDERLLYWRSCDTVEANTHLCVFVFSTGCALISLLIGTIVLTSPSK